MKKSIFIIGLTAFAASLFSAQAATPVTLDTCSTTGKASAVRRIQVVQLSNGYWGHRAFDRNGAPICNSEWSATPELNLQAIETLRAKGNNRAAVFDPNEQ